ncbi:MAG: phosphotransferase, partial [Myxococcota bacterium]
MTGSPAPPGDMTVQELPLSPAQLGRVVAALAPQGRLDRVRPIPGGLSATTLAVDLVGADGRGQTVVVRCLAPATLAGDPHAAARQFTTLEYVHGAGLAAPAPLYLDQPPGDAVPAYLVMEYIAGAPAYSAAAPLDRVIRAAEQLAD